LWDESTDRWTFTNNGSNYYNIPISTEYDNYTSWTIRDGDSTTYTVTSGDTLRIAEGNGINSNFTADDVLTITNIKPFDYIVVEDGDGTELNIANLKEWKFREGGGIDINWTDTSTGSDADPYDLSFTISSSITAGSGLTGGGQLSASRTISHADTSSLSGQYGGNNNGVVIEDITVDGFGHVTAVGTRDLDSRFDNYGSWTILEGNGSETSTIGSGQTLHIEQGSGIQVELTATRQLTVTNTDRGSSQNIFKNVSTNSGTAVADNNNDTLAIVGGRGIDTRASGDTVTIDLEDDLRDSVSYIGQDTGDYLQFSTNAWSRLVVNGTERVRADLSGLDVSGRIVADGDIQSNSDLRLKENIVTVDDALSKVLNMRGVYFNLKEGDDTSRKVGVVAQEIQEVLPEVVSEGIDEEKLLSVSYGNVVGVLIEAIKELKAEIEELKGNN